MDNDGIQKSIEKGFGNRILAARRSLGLTQNDLRERMGWLSQSVVSKYEKEASEPSLGDIVKLAHVLDTTPEWLAFGTELHLEAKNRKLIRIKKPKLDKDYDGGQGEELFLNTPVDGDVYLTANSISSFSFAPVNGRTAIRIITNMATAFEQNDVGIYLFFDSENGEFHRIKREIEEAFC